LSVPELPVFPEPPREDEIDASRRSIIDALLVEHQIVRDDTRGTEALQIALVGTVVAILVGVIALVIQKDAFAGFLWLWAFLPIAPLAFAAYGVQTATTVVIRGYYARVIERELHRHLPDAVLVPLTRRTGTRGRVSRMPLPSWSHLLTLAEAPHSARLGYAFLSLAVFVGVDIIVAVVTVLALMRTRPLWWAVTAGVVYVFVMLVINVMAFQDAARGYRLWSDLLDRLGGATDKPLVGPRPKRSPLIPVKYLVLPRPDDITKMFYMVLACLMGWLATPALGMTSFRLWQIVLFVLVFELVLYPARYLVNDMRDRDADSLHPDARKRARCPVSGCREDGKYAKHAIFISFVVRVGISFAFGVWLVSRPDTRGLGWFFLVSMVLLFLYSWGYEWQRTSAFEQSDRGVSRWMLLWLLVGCGGGLRALLGLYLGLGEVWWAALLLAGLLGFSMHILFATMTWALEATATADQKPHGAPLLELALEKWPRTPDADQKPFDLTKAMLPLHVPPWRSRLIPAIIIDKALLLLHDPPWLNRLILGKPETNAPDDAENWERVTARSKVLALPPWHLAPWDYAALFAIVLGVALGTLLIVGKGADWSSYATTALISIPASWLIIRLSRRAGVVVAAVGAVILYLATREVLGATGWRDTVLTLLTLILPIGSYLRFRNSSFADISQDLYRNLVHGLRALCAGVYRRPFEWFTKPRVAATDEKGSREDGGTKPAPTGVE